MDGSDGWVRMDWWNDEWMDLVGLSTSSSRFSKKFPVISISKRCSKVAFCNESCSEVPSKNKYSLGSDAKICKLYSKIKISKHFCEILGRNQRFLAIFVSWERISREPAKTSREA